MLLPAVSPLSVLLPGTLVFDYLNFAGIYSPLRSNQERTGKWLVPATLISNISRFHNPDIWWTSKSPGGWNSYLHQNKNHRRWELSTGHLGKPMGLGWADCCHGTDSDSREIGFPCAHWEGFRPVDVDFQRDFLPLNAGKNVGFPRNVRNVAIRAAT